jgi:hypothetical protein
MTKEIFVCVFDLESILFLMNSNKNRSFSALRSQLNLENPPIQSAPWELVDK